MNKEFAIVAFVYKIFIIAAFINAFVVTSFINSKFCCVSVGLLDCNVLQTYSNFLEERTASLFTAWKIESVCSSNW